MRASGPMSPVLVLACALAASVPPAHSDPAGAERPIHDTLALSAFQEAGMIRSGVVGGGVLEPLRPEWIDHFGASVTRTLTWDSRFRVTGGLGGIFQFRKPEVVNGGFSGSQRKAFFVGPSISEAAYAFGDPERPPVTLAIGLFPYKYNPEASNLGEYLFRSTPYPGVVMTGGYALANSAAAYLQGARASFRMGGFSADLLLLTETGLAPLYDGSLAAVAAYRSPQGVFDVGAGVDCKRLLPVYPERTSRENKANAWFTSGGVDRSANYSFYANAGTYWRGRLAGATGADSARFAAMAHEQDSLAALVEGLDKLSPAERPQLHYYSAAGTLLMARATFDPKPLLPELGMSPSDFKIFAEVALLGVENRPVFYTDRMRRVPIMAGINIPAFGWLDLFSVQAEWYDSPWLNNTWPIGSDGNNVPFVPDASDRLTSSHSYYDLADKDNFKYSLLLRKRLGAGTTLSLQAASDHLRIPDATSYYGPQLNPNEVTVRKSDWYWVAQLGWGI